jgi:hypothetical protein
VISGSGKIKMDLEAGKLKTILDGSGKIALTGSTSKHDIKINGSAKINAFDFLTKKTSIVINGSGNSELNASDEMVVKINGSGKVRFKGKPKINQQINGSGSIVQVD